MNSDPEMPSVFLPFCGSVIGGSVSAVLHPSFPVPALLASTGLALGLLISRKDLMLQGRDQILLVLSGGLCFSLIPLLFGLSGPWRALFLNTGFLGMNYVGHWIRRYETVRDTVAESHTHQRG